MRRFLVLFVLAGINFSIAEDIFCQTTQYEAIIMKTSDLPKSINSVAATELTNPGKIYNYGNYILINEKYKGVHIFDNSDPSNPANIGFITVPGCLDMAVKDDILYVDNSTDLVAIDIKQFPTISVTNRVQKMFPEPTPPDLKYIPAKYSTYNRPENTVIVEWKKK